MIGVIYKWKSFNIWVSLKVSYQKFVVAFKHWIGRQAAWSRATKSNNYIRRQFSVIVGSIKPRRGYNWFGIRPWSAWRVVWRLPQDLELAVLLRLDYMREKQWMCPTNSSFQRSPFKFGLLSRSMEPKRLGTSTVYWQLQMFSELWF